METLIPLPTVAKHPAKYTRSLIPIMAEMLSGARAILDPFGGTGRIFELERYGIDAQIEAIELEPEWANCNPRTKQGDALALPFAPDTFDAICTSPTYGNRMADRHEARDASRRNTYTHTLGRPLHPDNSGRLQWGEEYRSFHRQAWAEAIRVLQPGGRFVLNIKDHIRSGKRQPVTAWHVATLEELGLRMIDHRRITCPGNRNGENGKERIPYESVILFGGK